MGFPVLNLPPPPGAGGLLKSNFYKPLTSFPPRSRHPYSPLTRAQSCHLPETLSTILCPPHQRLVTLLNRYNLFLTLCLFLYPESPRSNPTSMMSPVMVSSLWMLDRPHLSPLSPLSPISPLGLPIRCHLLLCPHRKHSRHQLL